MNYVHELKKLGGDCRGELRTRPSIKDWQRSEMELGFRIPADYKELVSWFGSGTFGASICLRNPCQPSGYCQLSRKTLGCWDEVIAMYPEERLTLFYSHGGNLCFMGFAGDGAQFYYALDPKSKTLKEPCIYDSSIDFLHKITSVAQFIYEAYTGQLEQIFPGLQRSQWNEQNLFFRPATYINLGESLGSRI